MKKLFNNSTKGNDTQNQSSKSKRKFLKTFSFTSLALLMGIAGTMAFAPLGASPSVASASEMVESTTEQGLITPKADDPVIYTTESGIDIKWGNALPSTFANSLGSGNLKGFPYFTTTASSTTYTWVIIGFGGGFESVTPAGQAINTDRLKQTLNNLKTLSEIPEGCFLVLANDNVATGIYNNTYYNSSGTAYQRFSPAYKTNVTIYTAMSNYYSNNTLGTNAIKSSIIEVNLSTYFYGWEGSNGWHTNTTTGHIFPLGANEQSTFYYGNYLTLSQLKLSSTQWVRGGGVNSSSYPHPASLVNESGTLTSGAVNTLSAGYRPAFCLKIS